MLVFFQICRHIPWEFPSCLIYWGRKRFFFNSSIRKPDFFCDREPAFSIHVSDCIITGLRPLLMQSEIRIEKPVSDRLVFRLDCE